MADEKTKIINSILSMSRNRGSSEEELDKFGNSLLKKSIEDLRSIEAMSGETTQDLKGSDLEELKERKVKKMQKGGLVKKYSNISPRPVRR
jgi:DNA anti-recombination protein RmuC